MDGQAHCRRQTTFTTLLNPLYLKQDFLPYCPGEVIWCNLSIVKQTKVSVDTRLKSTSNYESDTKVKTYIS